MTRGVHPERVRFDALFTDPRHFRGDFRLIRTAVRRGWLDDAPQSVRDALCERFCAALKVQLGPDRTSTRALIAGVWTAIEMEGQNIRDIQWARRYSWAGALTGRTTGRPRERWHVSDCTNRIDANAIRRQAKTDGVDLRSLWAIDVRPAPPSDKPDDHDRQSERIALAVVADARYGSRLWLVCPDCRTRRAHLYLTDTGNRCRKCAGLAY